MTKLVITTQYASCTDTEFELPDGKTWDDVADWSVKWCTLYLTFKDGTEMEVDANEGADDSDIDYKRPDRVRIRTVGEDGEFDYFSAKLLAEDFGDSAVSDALALDNARPDAIADARAFAAFLAAG